MRHRTNAGRCCPTNRREDFRAGRGRRSPAWRGAAVRSRFAKARQLWARAPLVARCEPSPCGKLRCEPLAKAGPLDGIHGDHHAMVVHAAEYDRLGDFIHDETTACERCGLRWYQAPPGGFDADIRAVEGVLVCEDCAEPYLIEAGADAVVEHGTWRAHSGEVVG